MSTMSIFRSVPVINGIPLLANGDHMKQPEFHRRYLACPKNVKFELIGGIVYMTSPLPKSATKNGIPLLMNGDHMKQPEFHRRYLACPEDEKWELIGGIVYMASPLTLVHSDYDGEVGYILETYRRGTPGTQALHNATAILSDKNEPQPDLGVRILPEYGGQSHDSGKYLAGPPEMVVEIAYSSRAIDMYAKRDDYQRAGVIEYLVVCGTAGGPLVPLPERRVNHANRQGISHSRVFPGLWLDASAMSPPGFRV